MCKQHGRGWVRAAPVGMNGQPGLAEFLNLLGSRPAFALG